MLVLYSIILFSLDAMDIEKADDNQCNENQVCHLARVPKDIRDYLAQFLKFNNIESDKDFIERTKPGNQKKVPEELYKHFFKPKAFILSQGQAPALTVFCPNRAQIAIIENLCSNEGSQLIVTVIDRRTHKIQLKKSLDYLGAIDKIALSPCGNLLALAYEKIAPSSGRTEEITYENCLSILNLKTEEISSITRSFYSIETMDFNKQGTKFIMQGQNLSKIPQYEICQIISVEKEVHEKEGKIFDKFLVQKAICNGFVRKKN